MTSINNPLSLATHFTKPPTSKVLIMGEGKVGKTTFVADLLNLTDKGYHIVYLDSDKSINTIRNSGIKHLDKITYIPLRDQENITIAPFIFNLFSKSDFYYNTVTGEVAANLTFHKDKSNFVKINGSKIDDKTIIILDSFTAFCESLFNKLREKQGYQAMTFDMDKLYGKNTMQFYGVLATEMGEFLDRLGNINCTVFVVTHTRTVEKKDSKGNVISTKTYPQSTTTNSSELLSKYFDECLFAYSRASNYYISTQASSDICGVGGRQLPAKQYNLNNKELTATSLLKHYNYPLEETKFHDIGLVESLEPAPTQPSVLLTTNKVQL